MKKLLGIIVLGLLLSVTAYTAEQTKARYEKIAQEFTNNPKIFLIWSHSGHSGSVLIIK